MGKTGKQRTQWHPQAYTALRLTLAEQFGELEFDDEVTLGILPPRLDLLIVKKHAGVRITKSIGHLFRQYNIVDYKGVGDTLSMPQFMKANAYAFHYAATFSDRGVTPEEITLSIIRFENPVKLFSELQEKLGCEIETVHSGLYRVKGNLLFPTQIIVISKIPPEEYPWLHTLCDREPAEDVIKLLFDESGVFPEGELRTESVTLLEHIYKKYPEAIDRYTEDKEMAKTLRDLANELAQKLIDEQKKELANKDQTIADNKKTIADNKKTIADKDQTIADKDQTILLQDNELKEERRKNALLEKQLQELKAQMSV